MAASRLEGLRPRHLGAAVRRRLAEEQVVVVAGARAVGKSTLLRKLAEELGAPLLDLDDLGMRDAVRADPAYHVQAPGTLLIDEFQHVPAILDAVKAELNRDSRPGRYVLTGSTRYDSLPLAAQSLTGRVHVMTAWPLSQGELRRRSETFLDRLVAEPPALVRRARSELTRPEQVALVLAGGFPLALQRAGGPPRSRWYRDYVELVLQREVLGLRQVRRPERLPDLLRHLAAQTAQPLNIAAAARRSGLGEDAAEEYMRLLEAVFLLHRLPAWGATLGSRMARNPKVHMVDTGLGGWLLGLTEAKLTSRTPSALTELGHLLESFAVNEILKQGSWSDHVLSFGHHRTHDGVEVDLVVERDDGALSAVEIKAGSRVSSDDIRGLRQLRGRLGGGFIGGVVIHLGANSYTIEDRIHAIPLDALWM